MAIYDNIGRESEGASQNRGTPYLWRRVDRYKKFGMVSLMVSYFVLSFSHEMS